MAFNDFADREEDARVRPNRPIPSGAVSLRGAFLCGALLWLAGVGAAVLVSRASLVCAVSLGIAILLYDFAAKRLPGTGPLVLGICRYLNVLLALSAAPGFPEHVFNTELWRDFHAPALSVGIYALGITAFSLQEEKGKQLAAVTAGLLGCGAGICLAAFTAPNFGLSWGPLGFLSLLLLIRVALLLKHGTPVAARNLVKTGVLGICILDAGLVFGRGGMSAWPYALAVAALILPALVIAKWLAQKEA
jgi:4-hydroxybenzoate polyprenyltransferase